MRVESKALQMEPSVEQLLSEVIHRTVAARALLAIRTS